jgi:LPS export ABC transporter protein LptC
MAGDRRWIGIGLVVVAAIVLTVWALLQTPAPSRLEGTSAPPAAAERPRPPASPTPGRLPPVRVEGTAIMTVDPQGRPQWDIRAEVVSVRGDTRTVAMTAVEGTFFEEGEPSVSFAAPRGAFFIASRNVTLEGGAHARAAGGRALSADTVTWIPKARQIEAQGNVVFRQDGMIVRADRLRADTALRNATLSGNIRVTVAE